MMKRNILAVIVPALLVAGTANAAEIYNKDGNKVDLYGKAVGLHYFSKGNGENSYGGNGDMTYARLGFKGETQINSDLTGYGQWEYNFQGNKTRLAFAGLKYADVGSFDYGRNYGVVYDALGYTDMLPEFGGDTAYSDDFFVGRVGGVATYRNSNFFGLVDGLNFAVQYLGKNERDTARRSNGDGVGGSISYEYEGFGIVGAYGAADRTNLQEAQPLGNGKKAEQWATGLKYDANNIYLAAKDVEGIGDVDLVNYFEVGATYYFNKNMSTYVDYIINQIDSDNKLGVGSDDTVAVGIVYQF